jgi:hypothetical protein
MTHKKDIVTLTPDECDHLDDLLRKGKASRRVLTWARTRRPCGYSYLTPLPILGHAPRIPGRQRRAEAALVQVEQPQPARLDFFF